MPREPVYAKRLLELYAQGMLLTDIAAQTETKLATVARQLTELRRLGYPVPFRQPHRSGAKPAPAPSTEQASPLALLPQAVSYSLAPDDFPDDDAPACTFVLQLVRDRGELRTCGKPTKSRRSSYCDEHADLCFGSARQRKRVEPADAPKHVYPGRIGSLSEFA